MSGHGLENPPNGCKNGIFNKILEVDIYINQPESFVQ